MGLDEGEQLLEGGARAVHLPVASGEFEHGGLLGVARGSGSGKGRTWEGGAGGCPREGFTPSRTHPWDI